MNEISADYIKAQELDRRIKTSAQLAQQSLYDMCMGFKEMRDSKLYKELGYGNFEDYCEKETGFSRMNVYRYISIAENLPQDFVTSMLQIGTTKLSLLSTLSDEDRSKITENTDLESTSVRELEEKVKTLKNQNVQLESDRDEYINRCEGYRKQNGELAEKINSLTQEIKELESRPIEVAVETDSREIENLKDAMKRVDLDWSEKYTQLEEENLKERRELMQKADNAEREKQEALDKLSAEKEEKLSALKAELEQTKAEYEKRLAEKPAEAAVNDDKETFKAYLSNALDSAKRLCEFVRKNAESDNYKMFCDKSKQLAELIRTKLEEC